MTLLDRYIGRAVLLGTLVVMLVLLTLFGIIEMVRQFDQVGVGSYTVWDAFVASILSMPRRMFEIFPVTALVGSLLGLGGLASNGELTAMRVAGISINRLIVSVLKAGIVMLVFVFLVGELIGPVSEEYVRQVKIEKQQQKITLKSQHGFWARDGKEFVNIRKILPGAQLEDIYIYRVAADKRLELATYARSATFVNGKWQLQGILQSSIQPDRVKSRSVGSASWSSMIDPDLLEVVVVEPVMLPAWGLYQYMRFMKRNGQDATLYEVAFWRKLVTPFTTVLMLIIAVPFVLGSLREVSVGQRVFVGTMIGTLFYTLSQSFSYLSVVYRIEPFLATVMPGLIMLAAAYYFIRRLN